MLTHPAQRDTAFHSDSNSNTLTHPAQRERLRPFACSPSPSPSPDGAVCCVVGGQRGPAAAVAPQPGGVQAEVEGLRRGRHLLHQGKATSAVTSVVVEEEGPAEGQESPPFLAFSVPVLAVLVFWRREAPF